MEEIMVDIEYILERLSLFVCCHIREYTWPPYINRGEGAKSMVCRIN